MTTPSPSSLAKNGVCSICGETKPFDEFEPDPRWAAGRGSRCHPCKRKYRREWARENTDAVADNKRRKRFRQLNRDAERARSRARYHSEPERNLARSRFRDAVKQGRLTRPAECSSCGRTPPPRLDGVSQIQGHHHLGYDKPLEIEWLCHSCHRKAHRL